MNILGEHDEEIALDTAGENREAAISLVEQARSSVNLFTLDLDPRVFDLSLIHIPSPRDGLLSRMPSSA